MARCEECGAEYETERGVSIHRTVEHDADLEDVDAAGTGEPLLTVLQNPRYAFFLGLLAGIIIVGVFLLSPSSTFQAGAAEIGQNTLTHYQEKAPPGVSYRLMEVEQHDSGLYAVTLQVTSGTTASNQTVYASPDGGYVFESAPTAVTQDLGAFSK
ncbi:MAG: hypothetical protein ABEI97_02605 [Candidatus Nanohaloarchaea archaeon]